MTRRRRFAIWILILLLLVLIAGGFWLRQTWHEFRQSNGIRQLDWQGFDLSRDGISLERLSVLQEQAGRRVQAEAEGLTLRWRWRGPRLEDVAMDRLEIDWRSPKNAGAAGELPPLGLPEQPPAWLPQQFTLEEFHANLPCDTGRCELNGGLAVSRQHSLLPLTAELQLNHEGHHVRFDARLGGELDDTLELVAAITIDDTRHLELTSSYQPQNDDGLSHWSGTLDVPELPQADWLLAWLQQWQPVPLDDLPPQPEAGTLRTSWQLRGPMATTDFLARVSGTVTAGASLPEPWPIPGVATSRGTFELALVADEGQWLAKTARADLHFSQFAGWIKPLPETLRPTSLLLEIRPADADSQPSGSRTLLPLKVTLTTQGPSPLELDSNLALAMTAPWLVELGETRITASLADRSQAGWSVRGASADVSFTGRADTSSLNLDFGNGSTLALKRVDNGKAQEPIELQDARVDVSRLKVSAGYSLDEPALEKLNYSGPIAVAVRQFKQALVHTHSWELEGDINGDAGQVWLSGTLKASTGAQGDFSLDYPFAGDLEAEVKAEASGESGAEAWAGVIALWPENLMVDSGNVEAEASLWLPAGLEPTVNGGVSFSDLSGIHDRMAFSDLNGRVAFNLRGSWINLEAPELTLAQLNPGIAIGPLTTAFRYQASPDQMLSGELALNEASADFLGGKLELAPGFWDLGEMPVRLTLTLDKIDVSELMKVYPAEGLAGTGTVSGEVPVLIGPEGIEVQKGKLTALDPGGTLKLPADRLRAMAQGNQAMELVVQAVENFEYSVLNSTIDYQPDGTLILDLHLRGRNPEVQGGRTIVLNITLEEDIPALLTSLQLSGRVNEAVTEKVRELIEKGDVEELGIDEADESK